MVFMTSADHSSRMDVAVPNRPTFYRAPSPTLMALAACCALVGAAAARNNVRAQPRDGERSSEVGIAAMGDVLLHIKVVQAARAHGWGRVFEGLGDVLHDDEIAVANLETPLVDDVRPVATGSPPVLGAPAEAAAAMARAGIDVLGCANNHAYDQRAIGLWRSVQALRATGIEPVGADRDEDGAFGARVLTRNGLRVAFLSYTERINSGPGERPPAAHVAWLRGRQERLERTLRAARENADLVVLMVHWSHDFVDRPSRGQRRRARTWIELGADLILGTGPHVLQEVERTTSPRGEAVIAYSLGNLVSNQGKLYRPGRRASAEAHEALRLPETRDGLVLRTRFRVEDGRVTVASLRGTPLWTNNNHWERAQQRGLDYDIRVLPLARANETIRSDRLPAIRGAVGSAVEFGP